MALIKKEATEKNTYRLEFSVEKETFDAAVMNVYKKKVASINVPGFRKGKAPKHIVEAMYGKGVFFEDAINECLPEAYEAAVKEAGLDVVGKPEFDIVSADEAPVLSAIVAVKPEVEIKDYIGIEVKKEVKEASDEDVMAEIDRVRERNARTLDVTDRPAQMDDIANIDFEGFDNGVAFDGGKGENHDLKLGSGQFIPGFEEQIVGKTIGEEFDVNVTFPEDYQASELAGKPVVFKCKLNALKANELPALDDEFAKDVSDFDTLDEYKADVKAKINERNEQSADAEVENQLLEALIEKLEADIPEAMFVAETENYVRDYDTRLRQQGLDLKTYFQYTGLNLDALRAQLRPQAEKQVKIRLALEKIAANEGITVSDEQVEEEYARIASAYETPVDQVKMFIAKEDIEKDLAVKGAMDLIKEKAVVAGEKKAPAKRTTAKKKPAAEATPVTEDAPAAEEKKPAPRKRTTAKKTEGAEGEAAPAKKTTTRKTTKKTEE